MIKADIVKLIKSYDKIAVAVSGGSDSMALLHWFMCNINRKNFVALNIDHNIRGEESKRDSAFVKDFCLLNNIEYLHYDVDVFAFKNESSGTIEQSARKLRHKIFFEVCVNNVNVVATAHHADDQSESIFMHIARGCGLDGLQGMNIVDGHLIRPFLNISKKAIMEYIKINNIKYVTDSTNKDNGYSRNFVRNKAFPLIQKKYPFIMENLVKLSARAKELADFIDLQTPAIYVEDNSITLDFNDLHDVIICELIKRSFSLLGIEADIEERHINLIKELFYKEHNTKLDMPYNTACYNEYGKIVIEKKCEPEAKIIEFEIKNYDFCSVEKIDASFNTLKDELKDKGKGLYLDFDLLPQNCVFRNRRNGDEFKRYGGGAKSLGDYFTDIKFPVRLRDKAMVLASDNQVYAIIGVEIADKVAISQKSKNIIIIKKASIYD